MAHIFVSGFSVSKSKEGDWFISRINTSEGAFNLGPEITKENLNVQKIEALAKDVRERLVLQVFEFLKNEKK